MKLKDSNYNENVEVTDLMYKIDNNWNEDYVVSVSDEILEHQPFFLAALMGLRFDVTPNELEEIMKIYFLIWEYFKKNKNLQAEKVTQADFEKVQKRHIEMLRYIEGEFNQKDITLVTSADLAKIKSKVLLTSVLVKYSTRPVLVKMNEENKATVFIGIKSFIECFEKL